MPRILLNVVLPRRARIRWWHSAVRSLHCKTQQETDEMHCITSRVSRVLSTLRWRLRRMWCRLLLPASTAVVCSACDIRWVIIRYHDAGSRLHRQSCELYEKRISGNERIYLNLILDSLPVTSTVSMTVSNTIRARVRIHLPVVS